MTSGRLVGVALAAALAALLGAGYWWLYASAPEQSVAEAPKGPPQLYCIFIQPMSRQPRVEFLFEIKPDGNRLSFDQLYVADINGVEKVVKRPPFPEWQFDPSADPARLHSEMSVFDNSAAGSHMQEITIEIYKYRPETTNREWIEAGLKSIFYRNISGQCQQTRPVTLASTGN